MVHTTSIPCPTCGPGNTIEIEVSSLLQGAKFACISCGSQVGIQKESVETARKVIDEFENLKRQTATVQAPHD